MTYGIFIKDSTVEMWNETSGGPHRKLCSSTENLLWEKHWLFSLIDQFIHSFCMNKYSLGTCYVQRKQYEWFKNVENIVSIFEEFAEKKSVRYIQQQSTCQNWIVYLTPSLYRWGSYCTEKWNDLPKPHHSCRHHWENGKTTGWGASHLLPHSLILDRFLNPLS